MSDDVKQVKVDNWGIYFLQRLKHFFNRTDYCDLTLQFQDNAQLKVHRLVLSACTEYFELLERTCEMYEDCLVMPDDLQADVVVPIVNFMYTGQLEFKMDLLESLYQTSLIMNMPVLTKLLDAHRHHPSTPKLNYNATRRSYSKTAVVAHKSSPKQSVSSNVSSNKRTHTKAFGSPILITPKEKKQHLSITQSENGTFTTPVLYGSQSSIATRKAKLAEPRPTRYELPEEIESEEVFDSSFTNISYTSQPLIVHPETTKRYTSKKNRGIFNEASSSKRGTSTMDIVEFKKVAKAVHDDMTGSFSEDTELFSATVKKEEERDTSQLFDQILDHEEGPRVTIETKDKDSGNIDHAKIISEVLKKYPHLVKSNKNIKLKILNTPSAASSPRQRQPKKSQAQNQNISHTPLNPNDADYTFETDVLDSKEAARLIALGAENINGPWICLICGAPGRALHFPSYFKFRRHLVDVHNEKPVSKMCEYCGLKSLKRNYLLHHLYTKHGVEPPPQYHFPKCDICNYVALTESFLIKHKLSHAESRNFRCNVCPSSYTTSKDLLAHIRLTGHKYSADRRANLQCIYCSKVFLRENNLYAHLKTVHSDIAKSDGIIDINENDNVILINKQRSDISPNIVKYEPPSYDDENEDNDDEDEEPENQYHIEQNPEGNMQLISKNVTLTPKSTNKQKILNSGLTVGPQNPKPVKVPAKKTEPVQQVSISAHKNQTEEIVMIDNNEYVLKGNQLILRKNNISTNEYIVPETETDMIQSTAEYSNIRESIPGVSVAQQKVMIEKTRNINQPIQIVVSNEEEYKALIGSNHSIIFDEADSNKTLTVLGTPHTSINTAALSINNAQSNDMMIVPNNYQLNTSEAISADNPNIVVVYSDQIMSSQGIGAQFVQTSAVVTQNYETITTSTPVMSAHVIDAQDVETWRKNIEEDIDSQHTEILLSDDLQQTVLEEETELAPVDITTNDSLDELPVVNISSEVKKQVLPSEKDGDTAVQCDEKLTSQTNMEEDSQESQNESSTPIDFDNLTKKSVSQHSDQAVLTVISKKSLIIDANEGHLIDKSAIIEHVSEEHKIREMEQLATVEQNKLSEETALIIQMEQSTSQSEYNLEENGNPEEIDQENLTQEPIVSDHEEIDQENLSQEPIVSDHDMTQESTVSDHNMTYKTNVSNENIISTLEQRSSNIEELKQNSLEKSAAPEQLQTLTSEWSEDEAETSQESNNPADSDLSITERTTTKPKDSPERRQSTEETIENIQHEMQKQMDSSIEHSISIEVQSSDSMMKDQDNQQDEPQTKQAIPPQEKISSLLNDWEDNDSQEDVPENVDLSQEKQNKSLDSNEKKKDNAEPKNEDKIKSLVSDWDDVEDEEDNKND